MKTKENEELAPGVCGVFAAGFRKILWRGGTDQKWLMADGPFLFSLVSSCTPAESRPHWRRTHHWPEPAA